MSDEIWFYHEDRPAKIWRIVHLAETYAIAAEHHDTTADHHEPAFLHFFPIEELQTRCTLFNMRQAAYGHMIAYEYKNRATEK